MNALVTLLVPPFQKLTYGLPDWFPASFWKVGQRVAVPLGSGPLRAGVISALDAEAPEGVRLKNICWPLETEPLLTPGLLALLLAVSDRHCLPPGAAAGQMLAFLRELKVSLKRLDIQPARRGKNANKASDTTGEADGAAASADTETAEDEVDAPASLAELAGLAEDGSALPVSGGKAAGEKINYSLSDLRDAKPALKKKLAALLVKGQANMLPPRQDAAKSERCVLACSAPWPVRPSAKRQIACLEYLMLHGPANRRSLIRELGQGGAETVAQLIERDLVHLESDWDDQRSEELNERLLAPAASFAFTLTEAQQAAVDAVKPLLLREKPGYRLLYGVTGSGKTAVYMAIAREALALGHSLLLLAPEVALAHKLRRDFALALPEADVVFYHGYQSQIRRENTFRAMARKRTPCIVIGTRSALFLPIPKLGCIIMDEEHDAAFKQEDRIPYHAKEVAWFRANEEKALLLLGSATPDLKTWHAVCEGRLPVLRLPARIGNRPLPPVQLVAMEKRRFMDEKDTLLAAESLKALDETLARGEQAIILLNRRGYAPLIYCPDCRKVLSCPNCSVGLSYHRDIGRLLCHYCGYTLDFPAPCPDCGHMNFLPMGEGTERTADYLTARYGREVLRFDRDSTRREGAMEEMLARFADHQADILVGTQMVSKGHHFPDVTLAVVADGDLGLSLPDYRAAVRTFPLLVHSAGRAGRGEKPGRVLIQTR
ncbi:MAG: primosomal protein N', partial [Desulfovibrionaceae bacterium]|nr:primosomal protein N' [Desulfovibrionaceae bacterium]